MIGQNVRENQLYSSYSTV